MRPEIFTRELAKYIAATLIVVALCAFRNNYNFVLGITIVCAVVALVAAAE
jgi:hypothetical protein